MKVEIIATTAVTTVMMMMMSQTKVTLTTVKLISTNIQPAKL
jgi:hypothetical protein